MFNHNTTGYSLSDIAAVTGANNRSGNDTWGDGSWWIIVLFLFAMNGGWGYGNGFGGNGGAGANTVREEIAYGFDMNGLENGVRGVQQGLCDGFYAVNTSMLGGFGDVQSTLCQGFAGVNTAIANGTASIHSDINDANIAAMQNAFGLQTAINGSTNAIGAQLTGLSTQIADCCCKTQSGIERSFADLNYNLATQACDTRRAIADSTRDIIDSNNAGVRSILDFLTQDKIATLTAENQSLKFAASQAAQNAFITANQEAQTAELIRRLDPPCPIPAYVVPNPNCCYDARVTFGGCNACCN